MPRLPEQGEMRTNFEVVRLEMLYDQLLVAHDCFLSAITSGSRIRISMFSCNCDCLNESRVRLQTIDQIPERSLVVQKYRSLLVMVEKYSLRTIAFTVKCLTRPRKACVSAS